MARSAAFCFVFAFLLAPSVLEGQEKKEPGHATWSDGFPKVAEGGIDVLGKVAANPGFKFVEAELYRVEFGGGVKTSLGKLNVLDCKWGQLKDGKLVPKRINIPKGEWRVWVQARFTPEGSDRVIEYYTSIESVEIK